MITTPVKILALLLVALVSMTTKLSVAQEAKVVSIFDGKTLNGWEGNKDIFRVQDGAIVGGTLEAKIKNNEFLCTTREYSDFDLTLEAKLLGTGKNAGVQFRSKRIPNHHEVIGFQCDIGEMKDRSIWGSLYDESRRRKFLAQGDAEKIKKVYKPETWNRLRIRCEGNRIQIWLNDLQTVDYTEQEADIATTGAIAIQIHGGAPAEAHYRNIKIRELKR